MQESIDETDPNALSEAFDTIMAGGTLADSKGFTKDQIEAIYAMSYNLYQQGRYEEAENIFTFLSFNSHTDPRFWIGLGATRQARKQYKLAIDAYSYAALLKHDNPNVPFQAALCYLAMGNSEKAHQGLSACLHWAEGKKEHHKLAEQANALLHSLDKNKRRSRK